MRCGRDVHVKTRLCQRTSVFSLPAFLSPSPSMWNNRLERCLLYQHGADPFLPCKPPMERSWYSIRTPTSAGFVVCMKSCFSSSFSFSSSSLFFCFSSLSSSFSSSSFSSSSSSSSFSLPLPFTPDIITP